MTDDEPNFMNDQDWCRVCHCPNWCRVCHCPKGLGECEGCFAWAAAVAQEEYREDDDWIDD
jgi:hypothetical protein